MDDLASPRSSSRSRRRGLGSPTAAASQQHINETDDDDEASPFSSQPYTAARRNRHNKHTLRRVTAVSRHAALTTKQVVWDSNDASIDAALSAVDQWEAAYNALRGLLVASFQSAKGLYGAAKEGAAAIEGGFLVPVRDWVLLPTFVGVERAASESVKFLHSDGAQELARHSLELAKKVPLVGENVLAPSMCFSVGFVQRSWEIAKYPIPSKSQVRDSVDFALTGTKWALSTASREVYLYVKRADANITRTLSHTQWKVLGSGPYATLDKLSKRDVIDHLCERYFSLSDAFARYELAAHIRAHNRPLYDDLVTTGVLKERGGELTEDDEWLLPCPVYRALETPFLLRDDANESRDFLLTTAPRAEISALWFRLPYLNGKRPSNDTPWVCFRGREQRDLEDRYRQVVRNGGVIDGGEEVRQNPVCDDKPSPPQQFPNVAKWYTPNPLTDVYVDQNRHTVSILPCCPLCRKRLPRPGPPLAPVKLGDLCKDCSSSKKEVPEGTSSFGLAPLSIVMRPTFWRFYGPGDDVRRATWFLDTQRNGLQPFDEEAQAVLEDAYLFLNWMSVRQVFDDDTDINDALLTVEVPSPDRSTILVQFGSLTHATAIQKGLGAAIAIFKRRVYRGAWLRKADDDAQQAATVVPITIEESILRAVEENGTLGETLVPDVSIRSVLTPPPGDNNMETSMVLYHGPDEIASSLAVPPSRFLEEDMAKLFVDHQDQDADHLVLIVHGIGEMMRSIDVFGLSLPNLSSIVDCCGFLRKNHFEVQDDANSAEGRIEFLPVEWHEAFSILSQRRSTTSGATPDVGTSKVMLNDITLNTIPNMRNFANDTLMDVLYFMSPEHHDIIVNVVANEMNTVVQKFRQLTGFEGGVSVIGHSLGSIISWDILGSQLLPVPQESDEHFSVPRTGSTGSIAESSSGFISTVSEISETSEMSSGVEPGIPEFPCPQLDFSVDNLFLLGSPVAVFLMIRNQRAPLSEDFYLQGCRRVFNVFHPYDPVAYRVEPCIAPRNAEFEPVLVKHWNGGLRVKYQTKRLWRQLMDTTWKTQQDVVEAFEAGMAGMGLFDSSMNPHGEDDASSELSSDENGPQRQVKTGSLNRGRRIDYLLQEKEIESANEYVAALAAHSSYWIEKDFSLFIAWQISRSNLEREASEGWEAI